MPKRPKERDYLTVDVTASKPLFHSDGTTALLLHTRQTRPIAFRVDLKALDVLRKDLARIETFLRQQTGNA